MTAPAHCRGIPLRCRPGPAQIDNRPYTRHSSMLAPLDVLHLAQNQPSTLSHHRPAHCPVFVPLTVLGEKLPIDGAGVLPMQTRSRRMVLLAMSGVRTVVLSLTVTVP